MVRVLRPQRKMGHINIVSSSMKDCENRLAHILGGEEGVAKDLDVSAEKPLVGIIMGSDSDLPVMSVGANILKTFGVPFEVTIVSAHRTPHRMTQYAIEAAKRGIKCIIAGAGGAAHLPGMVAAMNPIASYWCSSQGIYLGRSRFVTLDCANAKGYSSRYRGY